MDLVFEPGPMNGRLILSYAVSTNGKDFFFYNQITGNWQKIEQGKE